MAAAPAHHTHLTGTCSVRIPRRNLSTAKRISSLWPSRVQKWNWLTSGPWALVTVCVGCTQFLLILDSSHQMKFWTVCWTVQVVQTSGLCVWATPCAWPRLASDPNIGTWTCTLPSTQQILLYCIMQHSYVLLHVSIIVFSPRLTKYIKTKITVPILVMGGHTETSIFGFTKTCQ